MNDKYYFMSAFMFSFGIAIIVSAVNLESNFLKIFGIFAAALFIGIGLLPFPMREFK